MGSEDDESGGGCNSIMPLLHSRIQVVCCAFFRAVCGSGYMMYHFIPELTSDAVLIEVDVCIYLCKFFVSLYISVAKDASIISSPKAHVKQTESCLKGVL
jgi:hypothetical protein